MHGKGGGRVQGHTMPQAPYLLLWTPPPTHTHRPHPPIHLLAKRGVIHSIGARPRLRRHALYLTALIHAAAHAGGGCAGKARARLKARCNILRGPRRVLFMGRRTGVLGVRGVGSAKDQEVQGVGRGCFHDTQNHSPLQCHVQDLVSPAQALIGMMGGFPKSACAAARRGGGWQYSTAAGNARRWVWQQVAV